jgi:hypothetical protein
MEKYYRRNAVAVDSTKAFKLPIAHSHQFEYEHNHQRKEYQHAQKTELLAYCAEDKVCMFLWHSAVANHHTLKESLT